ncbi:CPBP family glutamic-type intramembrane protease [Streptomyces sp. NPDC026673]|uniref:CPBP family glutamic-type intramembrane protease n=1 Tax=Streptomyces sp. NPDC026673 TaxID=3155724 RepID=UPI003401449A
MPAPYPATADDPPRGGPPAHPADTYLADLPPAGTPYHRMGRTEPHRWWRPLLAALVAVSGWLVLSTTVVIVLVLVAQATGVDVGSADALRGHPVWRDVFRLVVPALMLPVVLLAARLAQHRRAGTLTSVTGRCRWRWLAVCLVVAAAATSAMCSLALLLGHLSGTPSAGFTSAQWAGRPSLPAAAVLLLLVPLQAAAQEYVFRGWLPQLVGCYLRTPWAGPVLAGLLFALTYGRSTPWGFGCLFLLSLVLGLLVLRTGGLEAAVAFHVAGGLTAHLLYAASAGGPTGAAAASADATWRLLAAAAVVLPLYAWTILRLARRSGVARTAPGPAPYSATVR